jgi:hypothetical protein
MQILDDRGTSDGSVIGRSLDLLLILESTHLPPRLHE